MTCIDCQSVETEGAICDDCQARYAIPRLQAYVRLIKGNLNDCMDAVGPERTIAELQAVHAEQCQWEAMIRD